MTAAAPPDAAPAHAAALDHLRRALGGRYTIERELGRGGMGAVYLARDVRLDRLVALKVLPADYAADPALRARFLRETRTAAGFSHPNIVPVHAVEESDELLAYAMGLVEGETLAERVRRAGPLPARELVRVLQDVGYALAYAHGRGVVHRDVKPDNVMLERSTGRALVMDFGISRPMAHAAPAAGPGGTRAALTRVGEVVGTPEYMSPEQAAGDVVDGRSDLYALGLTAHFAATGRAVMTAESTQRILVRQLTEAVPPAAAARPDLPPALAAAIDRCTAKEPDARFPTAEALVERLDAAQLAGPEIPLPVRLFAGEAESLSLVAFGLTLFGVYFAQAAEAGGASLLRTMLPLVGFAAVFMTRALTTLSEARRLVVAGFSPDEVMRGLAAVVAERADRRAELRADPETRRRRRATLAWSAGLLAAAVLMVVVAWRARVPLAGGGHANPPLAVTLMLTGTALLGVGFVLLVRSPLRMPPGERFFRRVWVGRFGRAFVRFAGRGVRAAPAPPGRTRPRPAAASPRAEPAPSPPAAPPPASDAAPAAGRALAALEARIAELERWRREG